MMPLHSITVIQACNGIKSPESEKLAEIFINDPTVFNYVDSLGYEMGTRPDVVRSIVEFLEEIPEAISDRDSMNIILTHKSINY
jgi:hypothetical protein